MFPLTDELDYEPLLTDSFAALAQMRGIRPIEAIYDYLSEGDGSNLIYFPIFNYATNSLETVWQMLNHPLSLSALSDAGAHVGTICDASFSTSLLAFWTRDRTRGERLTLPQAVERLTSRNAKYLGLSDRGALQVGMKADVNVIDYAGLTLLKPELNRDLPAGGKRFMQKAKGYFATIVSGEVVLRDGEITDARPGKLVRK